MKKKTRATRKAPPRKSQPAKAQAPSATGPKQNAVGTWTFVIAAVLMIGIAFAIVYVGLRPSQAVDLPPSSPPQPGGRAMPPKVAMPLLSGAHFAGTRGGPVVFVEYSDFQCPYCASAQEELSQLKAAYQNMAFAYRHFPIDIHASAQKAAEASECAAAEGKFWEMHDGMFADQSRLSVSDLKATAVRLGMDANEFNACLDSGQAASLVRAQKQEGMGMGIRATPGFVVFSRADKSDALRAKLYSQSDRLRSLGVSVAVVEVEGAGNGLVFAGALPYSDYQAVIDAFGAPKAG